MRFSRFQSVAVALLLVLHFALAISAVATKSATFDEHMYLTGGYSYWATGDARFDPGIGMLPARWATLAWCWMGVRFPSAQERPWKEANVFETGNLLLYREGNDLPKMLLVARSMIALASVALGFLIFRVASKLWGTTGGFLSLLLYTFSPTMLAHGALVTSDLFVALFFTASLWSFWQLLLHARGRDCLLAAASLCGLALAKMSAVIFIPVAAVLTAIRFANWNEPVGSNHAEASMRGRLRLLGLLSLTLALVWLGIWAMYGFRYTMAAPNSAGVTNIRPDLDSIWSGTKWTTRVISGMREYRLLPEAFLYNCACTVGMVQLRQSFMVGQYSLIGFPSFFPLVFLLKTPLALIFLLGLAAAAISRRGAAEGWRKALAPVIPFLVLLVVYGIFALRSHLNIGQRHLLPIYPCLFILAGGVAWSISSLKSKSSLVVSSLVIWFIIASLVTWPNYLTYFNELAGGSRNGYRYFVDSSLDWGQDLPGLIKYLDENRSNEPDHSFYAYFGTADPAYYGIKATRLDTLRSVALPRLAGGLYCISASCLQTVSSEVFGHWSLGREAEYRKLEKNLSEASRFPNGASKPTPSEVRRFGDLQIARLYAALRARDPDAEIANSILVYRLSDEEIHAALWGPPAELTSDDGVSGE